MDDAKSTDAKSEAKNTDAKTIFKDQLAACLFEWTRAMHEATGGEVIAIDGKALRRSLRKRSGAAMLHLVTASSVASFSLVERERADARPSRLRGEVERDHGDPEAA